MSGLRQFHTLSTWKHYHTLVPSYRNHQLSVNPNYLLSSHMIYTFYVVIAKLPWIDENAV